MVTGDDLMNQREKLIGTKDMFNNNPLPSTVNSINAYLGYVYLVNYLSTVDKDFEEL